MTDLACYKRHTCTMTGMQAWRMVYISLLPQPLPAGVMRCSNTISTSTQLQASEQSRHSKCQQQQGLHTYPRG